MKDELLAAQGQICRKWVTKEELNEIYPSNENDCYKTGVRIGYIDCNGIEVAVGDRVIVTLESYIPVTDGWGNDTDKKNNSIHDVKELIGTVFYSKIAFGYFVEIDGWTNFPISQFKKVEVTL